MKTSIRIWLGLMSAAMTAVPIAVSAGIQHTIRLSNMAVTVTQDTIGDSGVYSHVRHSALYNTGNPGEPSLPVKHLTFSVPYDAYNISVSSTGMGARTIALQSPVYPAQEPRVISDTTAVGTSYHNLWLTHNLLGDPEFEIWTDIPVKYGEAEIEVQRYGNDIAVAENIVDSCKIVVCTPDGEIHQRVTGVSGWHNFPGVSPNSAVMIYHHNMIPYIAPLIVQNQTYTKSQYLFASTVRVGKYVNEFSDYGNVVFGSGVDFVVDASGDVYLGKGVIVNSGATVTVKSSGTVLLDYVEVKSGGTLRIEARDTFIRNVFEAHDGAVIEIMNRSNYEVTPKV